MNSFVFVSLFLSCSLHLLLMICVGQEVFFLLCHSFLRQAARLQFVCK